MSAGPTGELDPRLAAEFPGLRLLSRSVDAAPGMSPPSVRQRLRELSDGHRGGAVIAQRTHAVPQAYRSFFRQIGLNPDVDRTPAEQAALERLMDGHFRPRDLVSDALLVALIETGVGVWAVDADRLAGAELQLRLSREGERLGAHPDGRPLAPGRIVVADGLAPLALLFGDVARSHVVTPATRRMTLFVIGVGGVPDIHLEEALWIAGDILAPE